MSEMEDVMSTEEQTPSADATPAPADESTKKTELVDETMEVIPGEKIVTEGIDEDGDEVEEVTEVTRKVVKRTMKITEVCFPILVSLVYSSTNGGPRPSRAPYEHSRGP